MTKADGTGSVEATQQLFASIANDNVEGTQRALNAGADLDARTAGGWTPLMIAAGLGRLGHLDLILREGADPNATRCAPRSARIFESCCALGNAPDRPELRSALHAATAFRHLAAVEHLLAAGALTRPKAPDEIPPLSLAADAGDADIAKVLLASGACPDEGMDQPPLVLAAGRGHLDVVRELLAAGAEPNAIGEGRTTALLAAAQTGQAAIVDVLLNTERDLFFVSDAIEVAERCGHSEIAAKLRPLQRQATTGARSAEKPVDDSATALVSAVRAQEASQVASLLAEGANPDSRDESGRTVLCIAAGNADLKTLSALIEAGARVDLPSSDFESLTPLMSAFVELADGRRRQAQRILLDAGGDPNARDGRGRTLLMRLVDFGLRSVDSIRWLAEHGADPNLRDPDGNTALMLALDDEQDAVADALRAAGASDRGSSDIALHEAAEAGDLEAALTLLETGASPNHRLHRRTALHQAADAGHVNLVRALLAAGADPNAGAEVGDATPLITATYSGHCEVVRVLVEAGADALAMTRSGTALDHLEMSRRERSLPRSETAELESLLRSLGVSSSCDSQ